MPTSTAISVSALSNVASEVLAGDVLALERLVNGVPLPHRLLGSALTGSLAAPASARTSGIWFDGINNDSNNRNQRHVLTAAAIGSDDFTLAIDFVCPPSGTIPARGYGICGLSASDPSSTLNASYTTYIRGSSGTGIGGSTAGELVVRAINASGGDLIITIPAFASTYGGKAVRLRISRQRTATNLWTVRVFINDAQAGIVTNGTNNDWGVSLGTGDAYAWCGMVSSSGTVRQFPGLITLFALTPLPLLTAAQCAAWNAEYPNPYDLGRMPSFATVISGNNSTFAATSGTTWGNLSKAGDSFSEQGGGTVTISAGDASSWTTGRINSTASAGKMRLTASSTAATNRCTLATGQASKNRYRIRLKARLVSGTSASLLIGFDYSNRAATIQNLVFTPTATETVFEGVVTMLTTATLSLGLLNDADAAGQVWDIDDVEMWPISLALSADYSAGDGYVVRNAGAPVGDAEIATGGGFALVPPRAFAEHLIPRRAVADWTTVSTTLADTNLRHRIAANSRYAFVFMVPFGLAGTTSGYHFRVISPSGTGAYKAEIVNGTNKAIIENVRLSAFNTAINGSLANASTNHWLRIEGTVENGATEGDFLLQAAQFVLDAANALTIYKTARLSMRRMA